MNNLDQILAINSYLFLSLKSLQFIVLHLNSIINLQNNPFLCILIKICAFIYIHTCTKKIYNADKSSLLPVLISVRT